MAKEMIVMGATSVTLPIFIQDTSQVTGVGLTGLTWNTSGILWYYHRQGAGSAVAVSLASASLGTFTSGGFVEKTNMPGFYEISPPDAAFAAGASHVSMLLYGAANMAPVPIEIELITENLRGYSGLKKNRAFTALPFVMLHATTRLPTAGFSVTAERLLDGGSLGAGTLSAVTDKTGGIYTVDGGAGDANGTYVTFLCTAPGAAPTVFTLVTVP